MDAESSTLESSTHEGQSYYTAGPQVYTCRKRLFALTLEQDAYHSWKIIHQRMCARKQPSYCLVCEHDGPEYPHIHALYQYDNPKNLTTKGLPTGVHIEEHVFSPQKYVAYCKGEDKKHLEAKVSSITLVEEGKLKQAGGARTIGDIKKMSPDEIDTLPAQLHNIAEKIIEKERREQSFFNMLAEIKDDKLAAPEVYYIEGQPGEGKTYGAYKLALAKFEIKEIGRIKFCNQFAVIDNEDAKCFVIEEFRASDLRASELLQLMDKYGTNVNVKGGFVHLRPKCLIICSIFSPTELYKHDELSEQFVRRLKMKYRAEGHELIED